MSRKINKLLLLSSGVYCKRGGGQALFRVKLWQGHLPCLEIIE